MAQEKQRILIIGAHPDDADYKVGGTSALWRAAGHEVKMVSMTNGDAGHQTLRGEDLAKRRAAEAKAAGRVIGCGYDIVGVHDGQVMPSLELRNVVIRMIRRFKPDLIITHRLNDYHPDHRYTSVLVQDAAYIVTVPAVCPDTPHLVKNPIIAYMSDHFTRPYAFDPCVAVDVGSVFDKLVGMLHCHESQFYEWLPFNHGHLAEVPAGDPERRKWLDGRMRDIIRPLADKYRKLLVKQYGAKRARKIEYVEAFEAGEHGDTLDDKAIARLFPFVR